MACGQHCAELSSRGGRLNWTPASRGKASSVGDLQRPAHRAGRLSFWILDAGVPTALVVQLTVHKTLVKGS